MNAEKPVDKSQSTPRPKPPVEFESVVVAAEAGEVTLTGHVSDVSERQVAEQLARRVPGVQSVVNDIHIRRPGSDAEHDISLVRAVVDAFGRGL